MSERVVFSRVGQCKEPLPPLLARRLFFFKEMLAVPVFFFLAWVNNCPGLKFRLRWMQTSLALFARGRCSIRETIHFYVHTMDSVRYFEFDFAWREIDKLNFDTYLDLSSPRLFPLAIIRSRKTLQAKLINPDKEDLKKTLQLAVELDVQDQISWNSDLIEDYSHSGPPPDLITSISVIEHIPNGGDVIALRKLWALLADEGTLLVTVPVARIGHSELIDINEYNLLASNTDGFAFGQNYYSWSDLRHKFFSITGTPISWEVWGEREATWFERDRERKNSDPFFPASKEPYQFSRNFKRFDCIDELPGVGVIAMLFKKCASQ